MKAAASAPGRYLKSIEGGVFRQMIHHIGIRLAVLAACWGMLATLRPDTTSRMWKVIGPGGGGAQFHPTISPHDSSTVLVACDMTGTYITRDGGNTWRMFNLRGTVHFFVFDPLDPQVIYASTGALWRSTDQGRSWELVYPNPSRIVRIRRSDDHAGDILMTAEGDPPAVTALAVDPADSHTLYLAAARGGTTKLLVSADSGGSWQDAATFRKAVRRIYVDPNSPSAERSLYVLGTNCLYVRAGGRWARREAPGVERFVDADAGFRARGGNPLVYALSPSEVFLSSDAGVTWTSGRLPGISAMMRVFAEAWNPQITAVAASPSHPEIAYLSVSGLRAGLRRQFGVAKTTDGGRSWQFVWRAGPAPPENLKDAWMTERFGAGWAGSPFGLGVAPRNPDICYGTDSGRTIRTLDGGKTWEAVYATRLPDGSFTTRGLDVTTNYGVHFDPVDPRRIFISYTDIGLFRSENGGQSWMSSTAGVPRPWVNTTYWIEFDPDVRGRAWGVMSGVHDLPRAKMWHRRPPQTYDGGVCLSEDGGRTWKVSSDGMPETAATHILLDPKSPPQARVLYVAAFGRGVYKSADGGRRWSLKNHGISESEPFAWRLAQDHSGVLYVVIARRGSDVPPYTHVDGALYRSTDGAGHWERLSLPEGVNGPNGLAIDPLDPKRLYLAAWGRPHPNGAVNGGVFLSTNAGKSWRRVLEKDQFIYDVTVDARRSSVLYACGFSSSAWRSVDRGNTWQRIRGYNFKWGHRVIPDPAHSKMIYITTFGGSVWHGPAAGDPEALEDIVTPEVAYTNSAGRASRKPD